MVSNYCGQASDCSVMLRSQASTNPLVVFDSYHPFMKTENPTEYLRLQSAGS